MLKRKDKEKLVKNIEKEIKESKSLYFADFKGATVGQFSKIRRDLKKTGDGLRVIKNRLLKIALKNRKIKYPDNFFKGQLITLFAKSDEIEPLKIIHKFFKENEILKPKGGVFEEEFIDKKTVKKLASIPEKDKLETKLLSTLNAPISRFISVLRENLSSLVAVLNNIKMNRK